jgi:hypothetical protein
MDKKALYEDAWEQLQALIEMGIYTYDDVTDRSIEYPELSFREVADMMIGEYKKKEEVRRYEEEKLGEKKAENNMPESNVKIKGVTIEDEEVLVEFYIGNYFPNKNFVETSWYFDRDELEGKSGDEIAQFIDKKMREGFDYIDEEDLLMVHILGKHLNEEPERLSVGIKVKEMYPGMYELNTAGRDIYWVVTNETILSDYMEKYPEEFYDDSSVEDRISGGSGYYNKYMEMSPTDIRLTAQDLAEYVNDISDDDIIKQSDDTEYSELEDEQWQIESEIDDINEQIQNAGENESIVYELEEKKEELEEGLTATRTRMDAIPDELREALYIKIVDEYTRELERDPFDFFVNQQGLYSAEEFVKSHIANYDFDAIRSDWIKEEPWQETLGVEGDDHYYDDMGVYVIER